MAAELKLLPLTGKPAYVRVLDRGKTIKTFVLWSDIQKAEGALWNACRLKAELDGESTEEAQKNYARIRNEFFLRL